MGTEVKVSPKYSLSWGDSLRGAGLAVLSAVLTTVLTTLESGTLDFNWKAIGISAISVFIGYLFKNGVLEPAKVITTVDNKDEVKEVAAEIKKAV